MDDVERIARLFCNREGIDPDWLTLDAADVRPYHIRPTHVLYAFIAKPKIAWERYAPDARVFIREMASKPLEESELKSMLDDEVPDNFADKIERQSATGTSAMALDESIYRLKQKSDEELLGEIQSLAFQVRRDNTLPEERIGRRVKILRARGGAECWAGTEYEASVNAAE